MVELGNGTDPSAVEEGCVQPVVTVALIGEIVADKDHFHVRPVALQRLDPGEQSGEIVLRLAVGIVDRLIIAVALPGVVYRRQHQHQTDTEHCSFFSAFLPHGKMLCQHRRQIEHRHKAHTHTGIKGAARRENQKRIGGEGQKKYKQQGKKEYYITNGKAIEITCEKTSRTAQTVYKDLQGNEIKVNDGKTFIQICPINAKVTIEGENKTTEE